jgi:hypothetical protein
MTYTKQQKKQMRKQVYALAKELHNHISYYDVINTSYQIKYLTFLTAIKKGDFKIATKMYKQLDIKDEKIIDYLVFGKSDKINSEDVRISCEIIKNLLAGRKDLFKLAMMCDASVGYWKLSK